MEVIAAVIGVETSMKSWPEDKSETVPLEHIAKHIGDSIRFAYKLERKNEGKNIPYDGYDTPSSNHVCFNPQTTLTAFHLEKSKDQGRNALDEIIAIAIRLGIEQGQRLAEEKFSTERLLLRVLTANASKE